MLSSKSMQGQIGRRWQKIPPACCHSFHLEDLMELEKFLIGDIGEITVPGSNRKIKHDPLQRIGVGVSCLGASEAVAVGDHALALKKLS
jgi:glucokinase